MYLKKDRCNPYLKFTTYFISQNILLRLYFWHSAFQKQHFHCGQKTLCAHRCCTQTEACTQQHSKTDIYITVTPKKSILALKSNLSLPFLWWYHFVIRLRAQLLFHLYFIPSLACSLDAYMLLLKKVDSIKKRLTRSICLIIVFKLRILFKGDDVIKYKGRYFEPRVDDPERSFECET